MPFQTHIYGVLNKYMRPILVITLEIQGFCRLFVSIGHLYNTALGNS